MSRPRRFSVSFDGDPIGPSCSRNLVPMLLLTSLFFASSAAVISCPNDGGPCSPMDLRAALNRSRQSFATCDANAPPSQVPPPAVVLQDPAASAAAQAAKRSEETTLPPVAEQPVTAPPAADAAAAAQPATAEAQPQIATFDEWTKQKLQQPPAATAAVVPPLAATGTLPLGGTAPAADASASNAAPRVVVVPPEAAAAATATRNYASRECGAKVIYANPEAENTKAVLNDKEKDDYMRNPCDKAQHKHIVIELCETIQPRSIEIANFELFSSGPAAVRFSAAERFPSQQWSVLGEWAIADTRTVQTLPVPADKLTYAKFIKLELLAHHGAEHFCTLSTVRVLGVSMVDEYEAEAAVAARIAAPPHAAPPAATEAPVLAATPPPLEQPVKKEEPIVPPVESTTTTPPAAPATSTEAPPIAVVEAPPVAAKTQQPPAAAADAARGGSIVQEVMSGTLLKKIIEVVGGARKPAPAEQPRPRGSRHSAYAACDRTPVGGWPRASCARRAFFCPPVTESPAAQPLSPAQQTAAKRAQARRSLVAAAQRREEEAARSAALPPTQIEAPPQRKATTTPSVQQQAPPVAAAAPAAPTKEEEPVAAKLQVQQSPAPAAAAPPPQQQQQPPPPVGIFEGLAAGTSSHKESVFMKLNKRIAALELNMSLSTEYLSELSRQYIAHTDEQKKAMERTRVAAERAAVDVARTVNETVRDELFNLRKEVDALSAWLANLRAQAGSVALAAPRRISGAPHAHTDDMSSAEMNERPFSSAEVGHHRRLHAQMMMDMEAEDYVSYEESYETVCPYSGRRAARQGRAYGPQPRPKREAGANESEDEEEEEHADADADAFDLRHFRHHSDGIWTTEQVLYAVLGAQALTVVLVLAMQACYARAWGRPVQQQPAASATAPPPPAVDAVELERLISAALDRRAEREREAAQPPPLDPVVAAAAAAAAASEASPRSSASSVTSSSGLQQQQSGGKKKRRQRRSTADHQQQQAAAAHHHHQQQCRQCGEGPDGAALDWDSAMDSSLPSPSQTGSEEEFEAPPPAAAASQAPPTSVSVPSSPQPPVVASSSPKR